MLRSLSQWHRDHTFTDPTVRPAVKRLCAALALAKPQKKPLPFIHPPTITDLLQLNQYEDNRIQNARLHIRKCLTVGKPKEMRQARQRYLVAIRDKAILLLSYWYSLEPGQISRLTFEDLVMNDVTLGIHIRKKEDRTTTKAKTTTTLTLPRFPRLCPIKALERWLKESGIYQGALFQTIDGEVLTGAMRSAGIAYHLNEGTKRVMALPKGKTIDWSEGLLALLLNSGWQPEEVASVFRHHRPSGIRIFARRLQACEVRRPSPVIARIPKILAIYAALKKPET
ncbi:hypothetical protein ACIPO9_17335 [Pseudomonas sp. NPDC090203]|uniref:hypothetical protein n=1 Tax=Pseudomonas sp. NPDC090203 TaxID=3364477 RepID=UPI003809C65A